MSNRVLLSSYLVANTVGPSVKKAKKVRSFIHSFIYSFFRCIAASEDRAEAPGGRGEVPGPAYRAARRCAQQTRPSLPRGGQVPGRGAAPPHEGIFQPVLRIRIYRIHMFLGLLNRIRIHQSDV